MVRNVNGGNKSKGMARKFAGEPRSDKLVLSTCADERYAVVTNVYGGDRCAVITDNGLVLQCVIRKKFRGRHRRNNLIAVGCYTLVGLRDYETPNHKICDLLEVYSKDEADRLNRAPAIDTALLERAAAAHNPAMRAAAEDAHHGLVVFSNAAPGADATSGAGADFCVDDI